MAPKYQDHLAATVLNEGATVNYRMLSRALKVHVNAAKQMLYDFHRTQNARKPDSVHATYLLSGVRKPLASSQTNGNQQSNGDSFMSDGFPSSSMPAPDEEEAEQIRTTTFTLVAQEHLEAVKALYETISSIHIYSLEPGPPTNIHILSDCNRKVRSQYSQEDPLKDWKQYGTIQNPETKRRTTRKPPPPAAQPAAAAKPAVKPAPAPVANPAPAEPARPPSRQSGEAAKTDAKKPVPGLKKESSSLFKSFAKTKAPTAKREDSASERSAPEDDSMADAPSEGEEDETNHEESAEAKAAAEAAREKKRANDADFAAMMDASDSEGDQPTAADKDDEGDTTMTEAEQVAEETGALDAATPHTAEPEEQGTSTTGGRRRGRRRVMKKKTTKDAEGYLVTKEEPVWESFSEDEEPQSKKLKPVAMPVLGAGASAAKKSSAGASQAKKGQGNLLGFFKKK